MNEIDARCAQDGVSDGTGWHFGRCSRKGKYEEGGKLWCKQHLPSAKATRDEERTRKWNAEWNREREQAHRAECFPALLAALEAVEWAGPPGMRQCPSCNIYWPLGHAPDCQLAAAIALAKGETE